MKRGRDSETASETELASVCCICCATREIPVNGLDYCLPASGELLVRKLHNWWASKGRGQRFSLERMENYPELPVCGPCLDLIIDVERMERLFDDYLGQLWTKLSSSTWFSVKTEPLESMDMIHAAAVAAGILDDSASEAEVVLGGENGSPMKEPPPRAVLDESSLVVRKKSRRRVTRKVKPEDHPYGTIIVQKRVKSEPEEEVDQEVSEENGSTKRTRNEGRRQMGKKKSHPGCKAAGAKWTSMPGVKERVCPICGITLKARETDYQKHIRVVHSREPTITCKLCPEKFLYHRHLYKHMLDVHEIEAIPFKQQCELCGKVLNKKWCMREHMLSVHGVVPKDSKVFECPHCKRKYLDSHRFRNHVNSHIGVKPYKCPICPISMTRLENLRQHTKRVHKIDVKLVEIGKYDLVAVEMVEAST